jgi:hypothetical protein
VVPRGFDSHPPGKVMGESVKKYYGMTCVSVVPIYHIHTN